MITSYHALPHEGINKGGDCGPCCLAGLTGLTVKTIYDKYFGRIDGMSYSDIYEVCWKLKIDGTIQHVHSDLPLLKKMNNAEYQVFGNPSWENFREWSTHVYDLLCRDYIGIAQVHQDGNAMGDKKHQWYTNHWVLIKGMSGITIDDNTLKRNIEIDKLRVHISCPTYGEYTKEPLEFLMNYGGYNPIWVYPKK